jgi:hypothetical protein
MEYLLLFLLPIPTIFVSITAPRNRNIGAMDLGVFFSWIVLLYSWVPVLGITLADNGYGAIWDKRVLDNPKMLEHMLEVGTIYLFFLWGFVSVYLVVRRSKYSYCELVRPGNTQAVIVISILLLLFAIQIFVLGYGSGESEAGYAASYLRFTSLPLFAQQLIGILTQMQLVVSVALIVYVLSWRPGLYMLVGAAIVMLLVWSYLQGGSRTLAFLTACAYLVSYSIYVRKVSRLTIFCVVFLGVLLFSVFGLIRGGMAGPEFTPASLVQFGELISIFVNALDLSYLKSEEGDLLSGARFYLVDLARLAPQQFLWFEKLSPAVWYVSTFYPAYYEQGGGLAFGTISESVLGLGAIEALIRGGMLGAGFALVANYCLSGRFSPIKAMTYIWFLAICYQSLRDTTFSVFARYVLHVLPLVFGILFLRFTVRCVSYKSMTREKN